MYIIAAVAVYAVEVIFALRMENRDFVPAMVFATWVLLVAGAAAINIIWMRKFLKRVEALTPILTVDKKPDRYIEENRKLLTDDISPRLKALIMSNIAMGYCEKNDFEKAKKTLLSLDDKKMYRKFRKIYYLELAYVYFFLGEFDYGLDIVDKHGEDIMSLKSDMDLEPFVSVIFIFKQIAERNYVKANEMLFVAEEKFSHACEGELKYLRECIGKYERKYGCQT